MSRSVAVRSLAAALILAFAAVSPALAGKVKAQTFEAALSESFAAPAGAAVHVENLLGSIKILPQTKGRTFEIRATVLAEAEEATIARDLAQQVELRRTEEGGSVRWLVTYPDVRLFRMPKSGVKSVYSRWLAPLVKRNTLTTRYDGRAVEVGSARGATAIAVDLELVVPMDLKLSVVQHVGRLEGSSVRGDFTFEVREGELDAGRLFGDVHARTEGASARVWGFNGEKAVVETGSGEIEMTDIRSSSLRVDSARGAVNVEGVASKEILASTGSGKLRLDRVEPEKLEISTGTGEVDLATEMKHMKSASIKSTAGDVVLRLGSFANFRLEANSAAGTVKGEGTNVEVDQFEKNQATLARGGGGGAQLTVESESGSITVRSL